MLIVVIDKHPIVLKGLEMALKESDYEPKVIIANSFGEFKQNNGKVKPDVFILGLNELQPDDSLQNVNEIRKIYNSSFLIMYGEETQPEIAVTCLRSGANGYLSRSADLSELSLCIENVLKGNRYVSPGFMTLLFDYLVETHIIRKKQPQLSKRQYEIAQYLLQGMGTSSIAEKMGLKLSTVSTFKSKILLNLGVDNVLQLRDVIEMDKKFSS